MDFSLDVDLQRACRICLSQTDLSEKLINIFSNAIVDGFLVALPEVINYCVGIQILKSSDMPGKLCQSCKSQLLNYYLFKQKCKRTEQVLRQTIGVQNKQFTVEIIEEHTENLNISSNKNESSGELVEEILDSDHQKLPCEKPRGTTEYLCEKTSHDEKDSHTQPDNSLEMVQNYDENAHEITILIEKDSDESLSKINHHDALEIDGPNHSRTEQTPVTEMDTEDGVHYLDSDYEELNTQVLLSETKDFNKLICNICSKVFEKKSHFARHMNHHQASANVADHFVFHICTVCGKMFYLKDDFLQHVHDQEHHQEENIVGEPSHYTCSVCSSEYENKAHAKQHILSHLKVLACPFNGCGSEYASVARLGVHIASKHVQYEVHTCQHCGMDSFETMTDLQQHLRVKCTAKKFACHHCEKKFLTARSLACHLKTLDKKHECHECGKSFAQLGELTLHRRTHTDERPFKCTVCGKSFKTASLRTAHMDSHIDGKTFECHFCGKLLQSRVCYRNHIKRHLEEKKHECSVCSKMFYTKYNVKIHKEKVHKIATLV
ncbi:zinc finger protein 436-like [Uranotaenia lowii]|uniref:zinc finger protein 436-like n=1 Tax=Uranotaenia lowii TaxID=190385 RepID=UPI002479C255|nr:zinc finger protein 436-like [Uranotaenia lowii]XP_055592554.1 zinc finger protein 436-like [Uranotaenia lowii]